MLLQVLMVYTGIFVPLYSCFQIPYHPAQLVVDYLVDAFAGVASSYDTFPAANASTTANATSTAAVLGTRDYVFAPPPQPCASAARFHAGWLCDDRSSHENFQFWNFAQEAFWKLADSAYRLTRAPLPGCAPPSTQALWRSKKAHASEYGL